MARLQRLHQQFILNELEAVRSEDPTESARLHRERARNRMRERFRLIREDKFVAAYGLSHALFDSVCNDLIPLLGKHTKRAIFPETKILTALSFYTSGSYQTGLGMKKHSSMCQQSVSKVIRQVTEAFNHPSILHKYIRFPQNQLERDEIKHGFETKYGMPGVVSCIDCTHVAIIKPKEYEERYFNQKFYHSLKVQLMTDSHLKITSVDASHGGATHDFFIWNRHPVKDHLENLSQNGESAWLIGDSRYAQSSVMMTPAESAFPDSPEYNYNTVHKTTHDSITKAVEILKGRWRCLSTVKELHYDPTMAGKIVNTCCVLHNMCIDEPNLPARKLSAQQLKVERQWQVPGERARGEMPTADKHQQAGSEARAQLAQELWKGRSSCTYT